MSEAAAAAAERQVSKTDRQTRFVWLMQTACIPRLSDQIVSLMMLLSVIPLSLCGRSQNWEERVIGPHPLG